MARFWLDSSPPSALLALRDDEKRTAGPLGAAFVDPLAEHWMTDGSRLVGPDGAHPNLAGHAYLAVRLVTDLRALRGLVAN